MTLLSSVIDTVRKITIDTTATYRWSDALHIESANDAVRYIIYNKPNTNTSTSTISLTENAVRQVITGVTGAVRVLDAISNTGGAAVRVVERDDMNEYDSGWTSATASNTVKHVMLDKHDPKVFYVYPQAGPSASVDVVLSVLPTAFTVVGDTVTLDDEYIPIMVDFMLYRAYAMDADVPNSWARAQGYLAQVNAALGLASNVDAAADPNTKHTPKVE